MKLGRPQFYLILAGIVAGFLVTFVVAETLWGEWRLVHWPLHATVEALGGLAAMVMAMLLLQRKQEEYGGKLFLLAMGFLGMGLLDVFHSATAPGQGFVLLHSVAGLAGGLWFAQVWLPWGASDRDAAWKRRMPWLVGMGSVLFGGWTLAARETLPAMVQDGKFTTTAMAFNLLAGVFFVAAAARFLLDFHRLGKPEVYLFACVATLFGLAGLMFPFSALWDNTWWMWHLVRLTAYLLVLGVVVREYQRMVSRLRVALSDTRQAEEALRETRDYLDNLLGYANAPIIVWDPASRITRFNHAFERLTGYTAGEVIGQDLRLLFPEASRDDSLSKIARTVTGEYWESVEIPILRKGGDVRIALWNSANVYAQDGTTLWATIAQGQDITERKRAEEEIRQRNRELSVLYTIRRAVAQSLDLEQVLNSGMKATLEALGIEAGAVLLIEPDAKTMTIRVHDGLSEEFVKNTQRIKLGEGITGRAAAERKPVVLDVSEYPTARLAPFIIKEGFQTLASTPLISAGEALGALTLGTRRPRAFPPEELELLAAIGQLLGAAVQNARLYERVQQELAERKRAEEQLARLVEALKRSNAELERFAYVASHDLQEPLRMVASFTQLLARRYQGKLDADADEFIAYAVDGANRMQRLINDLLAYSRVSTRGKPSEPTNCEAVLDQAIANLRAAVEESGAVVTHDPLPTVLADASQLVQLFQNLIGNAIKFHGAEPPRIHVSAEQEMASGEWVFSVRDNGIGITPEYHNRIFVIFQRLHGKAEYPGTGIGLSIAKRIVERHGGRIWVKSEPGKGATFHFTIPTTT